MGLDGLFGSLVFGFGVSVKNRGFLKNHIRS